MKKRISISGIILAAFALCLVIGIFYAVSRVGFQEYYLNNTKSENFGWEYEIKTSSGEIKKAIPEYTDEYSFSLSEETYDAVKASRTMTETLEDACLEFMVSQCGVEVFLDDQLYYSDFQTDKRDSAGFLPIEELEIKEEFRSFSVGLPEDYTGQKLTVITYFSENAEYRNPASPDLTSLSTITSIVIADNIFPVVRLVFLGCMVLGAAGACVIAFSNQKYRGKTLILFLVYAFSFLMAAYQSNPGYYSGFRKWADTNLLSGVPADISTVNLIIMAVLAMILLALEIIAAKKKETAVMWKRMVVFLVISLWITAVQNSSELIGGVWAYFPAVISWIKDRVMLPLIKLCSSCIIYTITFLTIVQFVQWQETEWRKKSRLVEQSRFARENHELIMQVDEDSRRRNHEMKHHMQILYTLLSQGKVENARNYIQKTMEETDQSADISYSQNVVINSIVGARLNQAKKNGIAVQCCIYVPETLPIDAVDLNILLSNMLENAIEACMRMTDRKSAFIHLDIQKKNKFLYVECENSKDPSERNGHEQRTQKSDKKNHGFGLEAMRSIAEKYSSIIQIEEKTEKFIVRTNLFAE